MGYYFTLYGCQGSCLDWTFTLTQDQRNDIKNLLGSYNARLFLTFGGPGEFWEDCIDSKYISNCVATTAAGVAQFAADNQFDGIELSLNLGGEGTTNSEYANDGSFRNSTQTMVQGIKNNGTSWTSENIHLSSAASYYSIYSNLQNNVDYTMSYFCIAYTNNSTNIDAVSRCILRMYNEDNNYMTYNDIYIQNTYNDPDFGIFGAGSAVGEIMSLGVDPSMLVVSKPVAENEESVRSGYINPVTLGSWGCNAWNALSWDGGFAIYAWDEYTVYDFNSLVDFQTDLNNEDCSQQ